ncbi:MAG: phosphocholine cytidylyltransferase family protein [Alphaproteobacteria bacterium GM202ARS2]|nr:phosphocholine cytidylyltransferase family protein [Alphaproteobacteria bacterium GM202ARS2]
MARQQSVKALILAAGMGQRLKRDHPKILLTLGQHTLLHRHAVLLEHHGIGSLTIVGGYHYEQLCQACRHLPTSLAIHTLDNKSYEQGSLVSLHCAVPLLKSLQSHEHVLLMDGDVLYDERLLGALLACPHPCCFLRDLDGGDDEEAVKITTHKQRITDVSKTIAATTVYDTMGESVGFFLLDGKRARKLVALTEQFMHRQQLDAPHEEAMRALALEEDASALTTCDITGLPWLEIDFPDDLRRARTAILPHLLPLPS